MDSTEGHGSNLRYFQDERATNCLGQLEQPLLSWGGFNVTTATRQTRDVLCPEAYLWWLQSHYCMQVLTFSSAWASRLCIPATTLPCMYIWSFHYPSFTFSCLSPLTKRQNRIHLLHFATEGLLIDDKKLIQLTKWMNAIITHDACSSKTRNPSVQRDVVLLK